MAVGVSMNVANVEAFRRRFEEAILTRTGGEINARELRISAWLDVDQINESLMDALEQMQPFGQGNPEPVFGVRGVRFRRRPEVFKGKHFRFTLENSRRLPISGVAWKLADRVPPSGEPIDLAFKLVWNNFNGRRVLQVQVLDWRMSG